MLDVNYGGSTGYGRAYRQRLNGNWGIVDVEDCVNGARYLVSQGLVDGERLAITGGSAGGYTTLAALAFHDTFKAGASHYGVADLEALARDTHKFESRYLDGLIGPYPGRTDLYTARSPIHHVEGLSCPVIFFQGLEDEIVPPNQAETMVEALRAKGVPVAYLPFRGGAARVPAGGEHQAVAGGGAVLLRPDLRVRAGGRHRAGGDREPLGRDFGLRAARTPAAVRLAARGVCGVQVGVSRPR